MRLLQTLIIMGFISTLFGCKPGDGNTPFRSENEYAKNRISQVTMTPQTVAQLRTYGVTDASQLKLEFFFYTNTKEKAESLSQKLTKLGYDSRNDHSASNKKEFVITGWTSRIKMDEKSVIDWSSRMCDLGHEHDCEFDGWGTNPNQ